MTSLIAFHGSEPYNSICVIEPDGTNLRQLTSEYTHPYSSWSPNGRLLSFCATHLQKRARKPCAFKPGMNGSVPGFSVFHSLAL
jgi:Tol biopolymer transport system component